MSLSPINPAVATGLVAADIFYTNWESHFAWPYCVFPYGGSLIGIVLYEFLYKRAVDAVDNNAELSQSSGDEEDKETFGAYQEPIMNHMDSHAVANDSD